MVIDLGFALRRLRGTSNGQATEWPIPSHGQLMEPSIPFAPAPPPNCRCPPRIHDRPAHAKGCHTSPTRRPQESPKRHRRFTNRNAAGLARGEPGPHDSRTPTARSGKGAEAEVPAGRRGLGRGVASCLEQQKTPGADWSGLGFQWSRLRDSNPRPTHYELSDLGPGTSASVCGVGSAPGHEGC